MEFPLVLLRTYRKLELDCAFQYDRAEYWLKVAGHRRDAIADANADAKLALQRVAELAAECCTLTEALDKANKKIKRLRK